MVDKLAKTDNFFTSSSSRAAANYSRSKYDKPKILSLKGLLSRTAGLTSLTSASGCGTIEYQFAIDCGSNGK